MWVADGGIVKQPPGYAKYGRQQSYCYYPKPWLALEVKDPEAYIWDMYKRLPICILWCTGSVMTLGLH